MKIICLVKFVPNVENFVYDYEKNILVRENATQILNPDDACALAFALKQDAFVEIVSMGPESVLPLAKDLLRRKADKFVLISDKLYAGSDTYATSKIITKYLQTSHFDLLVTGTHSLDGDTSHIPSQIAQLLSLNQISNVKKITNFEFEQKNITIEVENERSVETYQMSTPCVVSVCKESQYKLPFVKYCDLELFVDEKISIVTNKELEFKKHEVGLQGSPTKVVRTFVSKKQKKKQLFLQNDEEGIEKVYQFLKEKGFV